MHETYDKYYIEDGQITPQYLTEEETTKFMSLINIYGLDIRMIH